MKRIGSKNKAARTPVKQLGEVRTSQLITSYGVGAIVDFKDETAILAGADDWFYEKEPDESRIIRSHSLEKNLDKDFFVLPKWDQTQRAVYHDYRTKDVGAYRFPNMLYCPNCQRLIHDSTLAGLQSGELRCPVCDGSRLVPSRFIVACKHGHIDDFPYERWVHEGKVCPNKGTNQYPRMKLRNVDGRNSIGSLYVFCDDCGANRGMQDALTSSLKSVYSCSGRRPWLKLEYPLKKRGKSQETEGEEPEGKKCSEEPTARLRTASGVYMPANVSALNIPPWSSKISRILQKHMTALEDRTDEQAAAYVEKNLRTQLPNVDTETIIRTWKHLVRKDQEDRPRDEQHLYEDEYRALCEEVDDLDSDFSSKEKPVPAKYSGLIHKVFAVTKLTEVVAMLGFTRLQPWNGEYHSTALAPIFSNPKRRWLPAIELHGEGIFVELEENAVKQWEKQNANIYETMIRHMEDYGFYRPNASPRYVLLHTLAHLLIRALAVNCGYQAASMKERIYSTYTEDGRPMAGILIYTMSADTEGSLGGLVGQAEPQYMETHLDALLNEASWCSSDPLCLSAFGKNAQGANGLNYAACPQCTLLPETACTARNSLLDRAALIGREQDSTVGYFEPVMII